MPPPFSLAEFNRAEKPQEIVDALRKINKGVLDLSLLDPRDQRRVLLLAVERSGSREPDAGILDYISIAKGRPPKLHSGPGNSFDDFARSKDGHTVVFTGYDETDHTGWPTWGPVPIGPAGRAIRKMIEKGVFDLRPDYWRSALSTRPTVGSDGRSRLGRVG